MTTPRPLPIVMLGGGQWNYFSPAALARLSRDPEFARELVDYHDLRRLGEPHRSLRRAAELRREATELVRRGAVPVPDSEGE